MSTLEELQPRKMESSCSSQTETSTSSSAKQRMGNQASTTYKSCTIAPCVRSRRKLTNKHSSLSPLNVQQRRPNLHVVFRKGRGNSQIHRKRRRGRRMGRHG